ncbi:MAG: hypothetical protein AAF636_02415 [Pseudomonadota bacterium]
MTDIEELEVETSPMPFDPIAQFAAPGEKLSIDQEALAIVLDFDDPRLERTFWITLAGGPNSANLLKAMKALRSEDSDPFNPGDHYVSEPSTSGHDSFRFSVILHQTDDPDMSDPIGYATIQGSFRPRAEVEDEYDDSSPNKYLDEYSLHLHPEAVFVSSPHRGNGYGLTLGSAMLEPVSLALFKLCDETRRLKRPTIVDIDTYFEIYSHGGEAAVNVLNSNLDCLKDLIDDCRDLEEHCLTIRTVSHDGGW